MRRTWPILLVAITTAACGPTIPLSANLRGAPVDIGFGAQPSPTPPQAAPQFPNILPNFPAPLGVPPLSFPVSVPSAPVSPCPSPPATAFPAIAALDAPQQRPAPATYRFRYAGTEVFDPTTAKQQTVALPGEGTQQLTNVSALASDGSYTFDVIETYNGVNVTTSYKVVPTGANGGAVPPPEPQPPDIIINPPTLPPEPSPTLAPQNTSVQAGLYLTGMQGRLTAGDSSDVTFNPTPAVLLMPFPAQPQLVYQGGGVDGANGEAYSETPPQGGVIQQPARVATCDGNVVDSWETIIQGTIGEARNTSGAQTAFTLTLYVATQYGGIIVGDHLTENGTDQRSQRKYTYDVTSNIDSVPQGPQPS